LWTAICPISGSAYHPPLSALLPFQSLFTESSCGDHLLAPSPSPMCSEHPTPSAAYPFQFLVYYSVFFSQVGVRLSRKLFWFIPGVAVGILHATYLLTCWSASPKQVWSWHLVAWEPSCFLSVTWHGETLYGLGVQGVRILILLGGFFSAKWAPVSPQNFWFTELTLSASAL
jgi:hypothetical protein